MQKVLIIGNYGVGNLGDEAILQSLLNLCRESSLDPMVLSGNPIETQKKYKIISAPLLPCGVRSFFKGVNPKTLALFKKADKIILGGGGLFNDTKILAPWIWYRHAKFTVLQEKKLLCLGQSVGPLRFWISQKFAKFTFENAEKISVRDQNSAKILQKIGISKNKITVASDLALLFANPELKKTKAKIAVNICQIKGFENQIKILAEILPRISQEIVLIAQTPQDLVFLKDLRTKINLPLEKIEIKIPKSPEEAIVEYSQCDLTIGMRFHSVVFSLVANTPVVALAYSQKVLNFSKGARFEAISSKQKITSKKLLTILKNAKFNQQLIQKMQKETYQQNLNLLK